MKTLMTVISNPAASGNKFPLLRNNARANFFKLGTLLLILLMAPFASKADERAIDEKITVKAGIIYLT